VGTVNDLNLSRGSAPPKSLLGVPKGVALLAFSELWERFSFYAILALLTLFLSADVSSGGWGWQPHEAILFYGFYAGSAYALPVLGAWLANNHLGEQRCIMIGLWLFFLGHVLLASPNVIPAVAEIFVGFDVTPLLEAARLPQGQLWNLPAIRADLTEVAGDEARGALLYWVYVLRSSVFYLGLTCLLFATGFFKSTVASLITKFYPEADARRDAGLAMLFTAVYGGAILANIVAGGLGEKLGWAYGFGAAALGISIAIVALLAKRKPWLGNLGIVPDLKSVESHAVGSARLGKEDRDRLTVLFVQSICTTIYAAAFFQKGGLLSVYTRDYVSRTLFGGTVPVTWILSISTIIFMVVTPMFAWIFLSLARRNANPDASRKLFTGLICIGTAYAMLAFAEWGRLESSSQAIHIVWIVLCFVLFGIADALVWPTQLALASKLAPQRYQTMTIGIWHLTVAFGVLAGSLYGSLSRSVEIFTLFIGTAMMCMCAAMLLWSLRRWMTARLHGAEHTGVIFQNKHTIS